ELLKVENLLLQLCLRLLQISHHPFVGTHVAEDADRADHAAIWVAQSRSVERGGNDLARDAARVQAGVAGHSALDHLSQRRGEFARLFRADEPRQRLLYQFVWSKAQQLGDRIVGLQDLALEVRDEDRIRRILDQALGV